MTQPSTPTINCPHCGQTYAMPPEQAAAYAGKAIQCTQCQKTFVVAPPPGMPQLPPMQVGYGGPQTYGEVNLTNGFAIASLVCGLIPCFIIPSILAVIFGIIGINKTKDPRYGGKGMAIAGLILGSVVLLLTIVFAILPTTTLLPSLNRARETANRVKCASNLKQIGTAILMYENANAGQHPQSLAALIDSGYLTPREFNCPSSSDSPAPSSAQLQQPGFCSYQLAIPPGSTLHPASQVLVYENDGNHNKDGMNVLFGDGHVEFLIQSEAQKILDQVKRGTRDVMYPPPR